jgi:hypothetical protein
VCCACGQDKGVIDAHAEDYSEPFAAGKTDEFHLCFTCHMILHCRFRNRSAWDRYRDAIRAGGHFRGRPRRVTSAPLTKHHLDGPDGFARAGEFHPGPAAGAPGAGRDRLNGFSGTR